MTDKDRLSLVTEVVGVVALVAPLGKTGATKYSQSPARFVFDREGVFVAPFERGEIGPDLFRAACRMGLEGLVSKRQDRPYQAGRSKH
jgi:hypothetical protein